MVQNGLWAPKFLQTILLGLLLQGFFKISSLEGAIYQAIEDEEEEETTMGVW